MTISTRTLGVGDWNAFWPLLLATGTDDTEQTVKQRYDELADDPRWVVIGAEVDGTDSVDARLIGFAAIQDYGPHLRIGSIHRIARLHDLYVDPEFRGRGAGKALMAAAEGWTKQHARYLEWQAHYERAAPFYEKLGYHGEACPQPDYPTFVAGFGAPGQPQTWETS